MGVEHTAMTKGTADGQRRGVLGRGGGRTARAPHPRTRCRETSSSTGEGGYAVNAWLRRSKAVIKGVGGLTIGLTTGATAVAPSSALESVESKTDDLLGLTMFRTMEIGTGEKSASTAIRHSVPSQW